MLNILQLGKHPDKILISKTEKGFDFLAYRFSDGKLTVAEAAIQQFLKPLILRKLFIA